MRAAGFTLVEVEVAITLIFIAIAGLGVITVNGVKQLHWVESSSQQVVLVPESNDTAVTAVIYSSQHPRPDKCRAAITSAETYPSSASVHITLDPLPGSTDPCQ
ncbi:MAG: prepilin-type N-terminal cleavage/methylation domain-containing protein [Elusimicrobiales bacterium]